MKIRIAGIVPESYVDGPGVRMAIFVQGCPHHCPGCHNPETHDFDERFRLEDEKLLSPIERFQWKQLVGDLNYRLY